MRQALRLHPDFTCRALDTIEVEIARPTPARLELTYVATGRIDGLYLPAPTTAARADELWKRTCFEAFIRPIGGDAYFELNFSPSSLWSTYAFDRYREGMRAPPEAVAPGIALSRTAERLELRVVLDLAPLVGSAANAEWRLGISAVIEESDGSKSYWALTHPPGKADFHHADGFALALTP